QSSTLITLQSDYKGVSIRPSPRGHRSRVVNTGVRQSVRSLEARLYTQVKSLLKKKMSIEDSFDQARSVQHLLSANP
ncbi:hypothetical protein, partial [Streptosporangium sp. NPDC049046]|uniref:hypothetical protein n=1 Tax=Streptosporangium sp. NPDC049046 TaxID=3155031 RepID=UPI0034174401